MGQTRKRIISTGDIRYTAYYLDLRGRRRSAGTFASKKAADAAWRTAESLQQSGRPGDPRAGQQRFADYVTTAWLPNHIMEPTTRQSYRYNLDRHIIPWFGPMKMGDILPIHVREWVIDLIAHGVTPATIRHQKIILSAVFTTALNDFVIRLHPCRGVKTPTVPIKAFRILDPDEVARLLLALPNDPARLLVDTFIGTGLRWGEAAELRPHDLNPHSGILTVSRAVVELHPDDHPIGARFLVKPYPKSKQSRRFRLDPTLIDAITANIDTHDLSPDNLLFPYPILAAGVGHKARRDPNGTASAGPHPVTDPPNDAGATPPDLGLTEPNPAGRRSPTAACPPTPPESAAATTAGPRSPPTAPPVESTATTTPAHPAPHPPPTDTSPAAGGAPTSGTPPAMPPHSTPDPAPTTYATPTPPGSSPAAPTSKSSGNDSATNPSPPPANTFTPSLPPTTPPSPH